MDPDPDPDPLENDADPHHCYFDIKLPQKFQLLQEDDQIILHLVISS